MPKIHFKDDSQRDVPSSKLILPLPHVLSLSALHYKSHLSNQNMLSRTAGPLGSLLPGSIHPALLPPLSAPKSEIPVSWMTIPPFLLSKRVDDAIKLIWERKETRSPMR